MSDILSIGGISQPFPDGRLASSFRVVRPAPDPELQGGVAVPLRSDALRRVLAPSTLRQARLRAVQAEIGNGTYETPERISGTVDRLLDVIA